MTSSGRETRAPQRLGASPSKQGLSVGDIDIDAEYSAPKMGGVSSGGRTAVTKPLFSQGDRVYASWWQEDSDRCSSPLSWYPGIINNSVTVESSDGHIVPTGCYSVTFDDGDEIDDLEEAHIMGREDFLLKMKQELKPKFEKGDEVYAAWWPDDKRTACTPSWYPGKIKRYREEKNGDSEYGPTRFYDVEFEDGDELGSIEDAYIFKREDYLLTGQAKWLGVKNVVDEDSHDLWANLVGYYTANIDGEEQHFTFLSDALRAYDAHVMDGSGGKKAKKSELNLPEEWVQSASTQGAPRKPKSGQRSSPRINAAILSRIQVGSRVHVKYPRDGSLYNATVKKLMMEKDPPMVKVHYDGRKKKSFHDISPSLIKGFIEGENFSVDQDVKAEETSTDPTLETSSRPHSKPGKSSITNIAKVDQDVDTEKSSAEPTIMASPAPPSKPSPSVASISAENVSLLFELAHSSMSREEAEFEADESIRNPILYLLKKSNTILKEALELYKEKNGVTAASRNPKPEIFEEYQVRVPSLFSLHEASSQDEVKCLASGQGKTLSPDPLVSSCDLDVDVCDNSTRVSDLSCAPIEKEAQNECSLSLADETGSAIDVDQMLSYGLPETSADATAEGCDLATKASESSSSSSHVARNEPESEINSSVHANNPIARISQKETKAQEFQGEIKVKVTVLNELIGVGMIASIASSAPSVNESKSPNSKGKEHATSKRSRSTTEGELTEVSKATQSSTTAKSTQSLPSYKGRGEIDRCVDHGKTSPSPKKRKHENCNGEKRVPNVSADDDAAATSIQAHLGDLQSEAEGNSRGPLTAGNKNGVKVRVRVTVSNIQIGEELAATIAKQDVFAIIKKRFASHPEIYRKFLEILHTYQKEPRGTTEVVDEVSLLFADHADLLEEFTYFLPDSVQSQVKAQLNVMAKKAEDRMRVRQEQAAMERKQDAAGMMGVGGRGGVGVGVGGSASPLVGGRGGAMLLPPAPPAPSSTTGGAGTSSINARKNPNMHGRDIAKSVHPLANTRSTQNEAGVELGENQQPSLQPQTEYNDLTKIMEEYNASMFSMHGFSAQVSHQSALAARVEWQGHIQPAYLPPANELEHGNNQQSFLQPQTEGMDDLADACAFAAEQLVDSMTDQGAQQPKEAATRLPESYTYQQLSSTMVIPPPDIRTVVDGTALFVSKNGRAFEAKILNSANGKTPKFAFLHSSSPFHEYYEDRIKFYNEGGTEGNGLHRLLEASNLHSNYYPGHPQLYSAPPQQAWPINTTQQAMLGYHGQFPSPAQPIFNPHLMSSPSAVFHQHGMSPNWRPSV